MICKACKLEHPEGYERKPCQVARRRLEYLKVTQTTKKVTQDDAQVTQKVAMTNAEKQRAWRQRHIDEYRRKNRERMRVAYALAKAQV